MPLLALLLACAPEAAAAPDAPPPAAEGPPSVRIVPAESPRPGADGVTELADVVVRSRDGAERRVPLTFWPLAREGEAYGDHPPFGTIVDADGRPLPIGDSPTCFVPDFSGVVAAHGETFLLTHFECSPAALYVSRLAEVQGGAWKVEESFPAPPPADGPWHQLCAGDVTPWNSLLSGEEYDTEVSFLVDGRVPASLPGKDGPFFDHSRYPAWNRYHPDVDQSPYGNGWMVETTIRDAAGATDSVKRLAMGRFSHELGLVMPDQRTVYLTDDGSHGILAAFVADAPGDLSAGRLYAARIDWQGPLEEGAPVGIRWVDLGHADEEALRTALRDGLSFDDLFDAAWPVDGACPAGLTPFRAPQGVDQCLRLKDGAEVLASRFETRRFAALRGATVELEKAEGLALDEATRTLYLALTRFKAGTRPADPPWPGQDHVRLPDHGCGAILSLALGEAETLDRQPIDSPWMATGAVVGLLGRDDGSHDATACDPAGMAEPDNITWAEGLGAEGIGAEGIGADAAGALLVGEDTDRVPNQLLAWQDGALIPVLAAPIPPAGLRAAEVTGLSWVRGADIGRPGADWATVTIQHPGGQPAVTGVVGPFPTSP